MPRAGRSSCRSRGKPLEGAAARVIVMRDIVQLLRSHVSVRDYNGDSLPDDDWAAILACGQQAATDATGQLYCAIELRDVALRERVGRLAGDQAHVHSAARFL